MRIPDSSPPKKEIQLGSLSSRISKTTSDCVDTYTARETRTLLLGDDLLPPSVFLTHGSWTPQDTLTPTVGNKGLKIRRGYEMPSYLRPLNQAHNEYFLPLPASLQVEASLLSKEYTSAQLSGGLFRAPDIHALLRLRSMAHSRNMADYLGKTEPLEKFIRRGVVRGERVRRLFKMLHRVVHIQRTAAAQTLLEGMIALVCTNRIIRIPCMVYEEDFCEFGFDVSLSEIPGSPIRYKNSQGRTVEFHPGGSRFMDDYSEINQSSAKLNLLSSNHDFRILEEKQVRRGSEGQPEIIEEKYKQNKRDHKDTQKQIKDAKVREIRAKVKPKEILDPAFNKFADPASPQKAAISRSGEYVSYWLRCIDNALEATDIFQMESIGYVIVFKTSFEPSDKEMMTFV